VIRPESMMKIGTSGAPALSELSGANVVGSFGS